MEFFFDKSECETKNAMKDQDQVKEDCKMEHYVSCNRKGSLLYRKGGIPKTLPQYSPDIFYVCKNTSTSSELFSSPNNRQEFDQIDFRYIEFCYSVLNGSENARNE